MSKTNWSAPHYGMCASLLVVGMIAGRAFFPLEVPKAFIVEKEKRIEVPIERIVIQKEPFEVIKYIDRIVEKQVEVPVEKILYRDTATGVDGVPSKVYPSAWRHWLKDRVNRRLLRPWDVQSGNGLGTAPMRNGITPTGSPRRQRHFSTIVSMPGVSRNENCRFVPLAAW